LKISRKKNVFFFLKFPKFLNFLWNSLSNSLRNFEIFKKKKRSQDEFYEMQKLIKKYESISACFEYAKHFVKISYNALSIFHPSKEKTILQNLTTFSLERSF